MFADVTFSTEGIVIITTLLIALSGVVGTVFRMLVTAKDEKFALALKLSEDLKKSYKEIAEEAVRVSENRAGVKLVRIAPVVPEHSSPVTPEQQETADLQTLRARVTAVTLAEGLPPRIATLPTDLPPVVVEEIKAQIQEVKTAVEEVKVAIEETPDKIVKKIKADEPPN